MIRRLLLALGIAMFATACESTLSGPESFDACTRSTAVQMGTRSAVATQPTIGIGMNNGS